MKAFLLREYNREMSLEEVKDPSPGPVEVVQQETKGIGADLVVETSGSPQGPQMAIAMAKRMGKILLLGFPEEPVSADFSIRVSGPFCGDVFRFPHQTHGAFWHRRQSLRF